VPFFYREVSSTRSSSFFPRYLNRPPFPFNQGWSVIKELFADERFKGKMSYSFEPRFNEAGDRVYGTFSAGMFMEHIQVGVPLLLLQMKAVISLPKPHINSFSLLSTAESHS